MAQTEILLESGTNELEIVEFRVDFKEDDGSITPGYYGVNVSKVKEIIKSPEGLSGTPKSNPSIAGVINLRGKIIPIVDLPQWLNKRDDDVLPARIIIMEFNKVTTGFLVHSVVRIHRVSWESVNSPAGIVSKAEEECVTGIVKFDKKIVMMLDFEKVVTEINPDSGARSNDAKKCKTRSGKTVFIVEDSIFMNKRIVETLTKAGYRVFSSINGKEALQKLIGVAKEAVENKVPLSSYLSCIVTDVEMPKMDGLHLAARLTAHSSLKAIPIIVFSSIVDDSNKKKWDSLGVNKFVSKSDIDEIVHAVDRTILK